MSKIIDTLSSFIKKHPIYSILFSIVFGGMLINILSDILSQEFGSFTAIVILAIGFLVVFIITTIHILNENRKRKQLGTTPFEPLGERYKGLIVSISIINEAKEEITNKINSVKDLNDVEGLNKLYELRGIGQTFRAIIHHLKELEVCWLLYTEDSVEGKEVVEHFIKKFGSGIVNSIPILIENPNNIKSIFKTINEIYVKGLEEVNLHETEVIADITGGTTPMSSAIILACTSSDRNIEYVEQDTNALIKAEHI